jgi:hypothetical protein
MNMEDILAAASIRRDMDEAMYEAALASADPEVLKVLDAAFDDGTRAARAGGPDECAYPTVEAEMAYIRGYREFVN